MHRIISGIVVAAETEPDKRLKGTWREHCQKLGNRLEDPYLRIMMAHLAFDDWITVVEEVAIPLRDRLNIALRFLDDGQVRIASSLLDGCLIHPIAWSIFPKCEKGTRKIRRPGSAFIHRPY
jgi:hypothetical protein